MLWFPFRPGTGRIRRLNSPIQGWKILRRYWRSFSIGRVSYEYTSSQSCWPTAHHLLQASSRCSEFDRNVSKSLLHAKYAVPARPRYVVVEAHHGVDTLSLHRFIDVDADVCISVAAIGHVVDNARCEIRSANGRHSVTKHPELQSASTRIWSSVVLVSTNC